SADRASLQAATLVSGNFTGNFAILISQKPSSLHETAVLQRLLVQFPTQIPRKIISRTRNFSNGIRDLGPESIDRGRVTPLWGLRPQFILMPPARRGSSFR